MPHPHAVPSKGHLPALFSPQGPAWGSKDKCFSKMYTASGECCKACNLGEGVVQPCGLNQTVCEPCLDSEYPAPVALGTASVHRHLRCTSSSPPRSVAWARFAPFHSAFPRTTLAGTGSSSALTLGLLPAPLQTLCPANPCPGCSISPRLGPVGTRHLCRSPLQRLLPHGQHCLQKTPPDCPLVCDAATGTRPHEPPILVFF